MTTADICQGLPSTKINSFTPKLILSSKPVAETKDWERHSTTFQKKDPIQQRACLINFPEIHDIGLT